MKGATRIAGVSGSLRKGSYNTAALRAAANLAPEDIEIDIITLEDIPLFNEDVEAKGFPDPVVRLHETIRPVDGVLFSTPEYNYSIPGVLKNAIDWLSRPERKSSIYKKPAAIMGATPSMIGTARAQAHLRQVAYYNAMPLLASSEVLIFRAGEKFDDDGRLQDEETKKFLADMIIDFRDWIRRLRT
ncbi:NADPH-dependent FMN reductase [Chelativorans alearense]|uniref:NADPH-dependent FMN reductase n=1 Tax=Chelativorans alearense TaxID=2681495 RepID=UPI0013D898B1|nr:NAD(P)H-dependent oxidoreductase [Chelativorans alearense]